MFYKLRVNILILVIQREIVQFYPMQTREVNSIFPKYHMCMYHHRGRISFFFHTPNQHFIQGGATAVKTFWITWYGPHLGKGSWHCFELPLNFFLFKTGFFICEKADSARRTRHRNTLTGWQALGSGKSPRLKSLNQTGGELILARAHLGWMPPTLDFYRLALWWKLLKPLGYAHLREGLL